MRRKTFEVTVGKVMALLLLIFLGDWAWGDVVYSPPQCFSQKKYPCALFSSYPGKLKNNKGHIYFKKDCKMAFLNASTLLLLDGDFVLVGNPWLFVASGKTLIYSGDQTVSLLNVKTTRLHIKVYGGPLIVKSGSSIDLKLSSYQQVSKTVDRWTMIRYFQVSSNDFKEWIGYPREVSTYFSLLRDRDDQDAQRKSVIYAYRTIAQSFQDERELKYQKYLEHKLKQEHFLKKLKHWFRQRFYDRQSWERFLDSPEFERD